MAKSIPDTYRRVTPGLIVRDAAKALDFYRAAFGAQERMRMPGPDGKIAHAEIEIGDSVIMVDDESPGMGATSPTTLGGSPVFLYIYVDDVDEVVKRTVGLGAETIRPVEDQFYGDRGGQIRDPFGHVWNVATHIEDVSAEEMARRAAAAAS
jgi:PhnB protein